MTDLSRLCALVAVGWLVLAPGADARSYPSGPHPRQQKIDVRQLPSLLVEWRWKGEVDEWRLEDGTVYLVGGDRLTAIDAETGATLWDHDLERDCSCSKLEVLADRIVAGIDGRAILIDRASGALAADLPLGESITSVLAEPLVLTYRDALGIHTMVRLDESSGVEVARYGPQGTISKVERLGKRLIVGGTPREEGSTVAALDLSLNQLWRRELPSVSWWRREGDELIVESWGQRVKTVQTLDPATGDLLARPGATASLGPVPEVKIEALAGGLALVLRNKELPMLVRPSGRAGDPLWQVELPIVVSSSVEWGDRVVLAKEAWGTRGVVLIVDTEDGRILARAAGLRGMGDLRTSGDLLISDTASGLAAVRLDSFGPSEAASTTVEEAVNAILAELADPVSAPSPYSVRQELEDLGTEALPFLTGAIPDVAPDALVMIAGLVSTSGYRPAAAPLAERASALLREPPSESKDERWEQRSHLQGLARALVPISGPEQAAIFDRFLEQDAVSGHARLPVMAALGRLAPDLAAAALARLRAHQSPSDRWLVTPSAPAWLEAVAADIDPAAREGLWASDRTAEVQELVRGELTAIAESESGRWIVFPDAQFGSPVFWAAPLSDDGSTGEPAFAGSVPQPDFEDQEGSEVAALEARVRGNLLEIGYPGVRPLAVGLDELRLDSDRDGLTDRLEAFLGLDAGAPDSDGDGLLDPEDPAPHGRRQPPVTDEEKALLALHEVLQLVQTAASDDAIADDEGQPGFWTEERHAFLTGVPLLEWRGGPGATFVADRDAPPVCSQRSYRQAARPPRALANDEIAFEVNFPCALFDDAERVETYVLRSTASGWVLSGLGW